MSDAWGEAFVRVRFDDDQATRDLDRTVKRAVDDVEGKGTAKKRSTPGNRASNAGVVADELRELAGQGPAASRALNAVEGATGGLTTPQLALGAAVAVTTAAYLKMANAGIDAYIGLADQVRTFTERTGASADEASRFVAITDDYGVSADTTANAMFFLSRAVATNEEGLRKLGVATVRNKDGSADLRGTLVNVADAYRNSNDQAERAALIQGALGRQGRELIPILEQGGAALEKLLASTPSGQLLTEKDLANARAFELATDNLSDSFQEISVSIGKDLVPQIAAVADGLGNAVRWANELLEPIGGLGTLLARLPEVIPGWGQLIQGARLWGDYKEAATDALDTTSGAADNLTEDLDKLYEQQVKLLEDQLKIADANYRLETSTVAVGDAQKEYADALNRTGKYAEADLKATRALAAARERLSDATRKVRDAEEDVADKRREAAEIEYRLGVGSQAAIDARRDVRDAEEELGETREDATDAATGVKDAEQDLWEAKQKGGRGSRELAEAERDLRRAHDEQKEAALNAAKAAVQLKDDQAEANGELRTGEQRADDFRAALGRITGDLAPGSPLRTYLEEVTKQVSTLLPDLNALVVPPEPPQVGAGGLAPGAVGSGGLAGDGGATGAGGLAGPGGTQAGVSSLGGGVNVTQYATTTTDPVHLAHEIAWVYTP